MDELPLPWPEFREVWREVPDFEGFEISSNGRVRSWKGWNGRRKPLPRIRAMTAGPSGYPQTVVRCGGQERSLRAHRQILIAFVGDGPPGRQACHIDGDATNCSVNNLYWGTRSQNVTDWHRHKREKTKPARRRVAFRDPRTKPAGLLSLPWPDNREVWKAIPGYGRYEVSSEGRVRSWGPTGDESRDAPHIMRLQSASSGHMNLFLQVGRGRGMSKRRLAHHLVLEAFVGPAPEGQICRHLDGNPKNNSINNLAWGTSSENRIDAYRHGTARLPRVRGEANHCAKLTSNDVREIRRLAASGVDHQILAARKEVNIYTIRRVVNRKTWAHIT